MASKTDSNWYRNYIYIVKPVRDKQIDDRIKTYLESRTSSDMFSIGLAVGVGEDNNCCIHCVTRRAYSYS